MVEYKDTELSPSRENTGNYICRPTHLHSIPAELWQNISYFEIQDDSTQKPAAFAPM